MNTPVLETSRLILRPLALSDAPAIQRHFNNWNVIRQLSAVVPWPYPDDGAESFVGHVDLPHHDGQTRSEKWRMTRENWLRHRSTDRS